jgi:hypothetical protein
MKIKRKYNILMLLMAAFGTLNAMELEVKIKADHRSSKNEFTCPLLAKKEREKLYALRGPFAYMRVHAITMLKEVQVGALDKVKDVSWVCDTSLERDTYRVSWNVGQAEPISRTMPADIIEPYKKGKIRLEGVFKGDPLFSGNGNFFVVAHDEAALKELGAGLTREQFKLIDAVDRQLAHKKKAVIKSDKAEMFELLPLRVRKNLGRVCIFQKDMPFCSMLGWLLCGSR